MNVKETPPCLVGFADGGTSTSSRMGDLILTDKISLIMISVSKLLKHNRCFALFTDTICVFQDRSSKTLIGADEERDVVYDFKDVRVVCANRADGSKDQLLWHRRLGHPAFRTFSDISELSCVLNKA